MATDNDKLRTYLLEAEQELEDLRRTTSGQKQQLLSGIKKLARLCEPGTPALQDSIKAMIAAFDQGEAVAIEQALQNFTDTIIKKDDLSVEELTDQAALVVGNSGALLSEALFQLLEKIPLPELVEHDKLRLQEMLERTLDEDSWNDCMQLVSGIGDKIGQHVYQERHEVEQFLNLVCEQLAELESMLLNPEQANTDSQFSELQNALEKTVSQFSVEHSDAAELSALQQGVVNQMSALASRLNMLREISKSNEATSKVAIDALITLVRKLQEEADKLRRKVKAAKLLAITDPLTRLPNRQAYNDRVNLEFMRWKRFNTPLSLLVWDVDFFKRINDNFGHIAGDNALKAVARLLKSNLRETDFLARFGGEEFVFLMPGADTEAAIKIADKIRQKVANSPFHMRGKPVELTISCGVATFGANDDPEKVFSRADAALYQAKNEGRNRVVAA